MPGLSMRVISRQSSKDVVGGGEVHYLSSCASGRITRMLLADICGDADIFRRLSCGMRDGLLRNINSIWQKRVVDEMSEQLREFADLGGFAAASIATFFAPARSFALCNVGNPPPLLFRAADRSWQALYGECDTVAPSAPHDGLLDPVEYRHLEMKLELGDLIVLFGNGFAEQAFPGGDMVGHQRLLDSLQQTPHSDPKSRINHLIRLVLDDHDLREDCNIMVCEVTETRVRMRDNLLAPFRLFQRPQDETQFS